MQSGGHASKSDDCLAMLWRLTNSAEEAVGLQDVIG